MLYEVFLKAISHKIKQFETLKKWEMCGNAEEICDDLKMRRQRRRAMGSGVFAYKGN